MVDPRINCKGKDFVRTFNKAYDVFGYTSSIWSNNCSELICRDFDLWAHQNGVILYYQRPGKPIDSAFLESFKGKLRAERLNA